MTKNNLNRVLAPKEADDTALDLALRPASFSEYVGQENVKENLAILVGAAKKRAEPLEHILIHGPSGLGKTTLAYIIAKEFGAGIRITSGAALDKAGDVGSILTGLSDGDFLFIDEIHRLNKTVEETLYPAMENYKLDIIIGKGASAKTLQINLPRFTLIGATTRISLLSNPSGRVSAFTISLIFTISRKLKKSWPARPACLKSRSRLKRWPKSPLLRALRPALPTGC